MGLETTMLGNSKLRPLGDVLADAKRLEEASQKGNLDESMQKLQAAPQGGAGVLPGVFLEAIKTGTGNLKENQEKFEAADSIEYQLISIPEVARVRHHAPLAGTAQGLNDGSTKQPEKSATEERG